MNIGNTSIDSLFSSANDAGDSSYTDDELLGAYKDLSYEECRNIMRYWPLGARIATALPNFAMSAGRKFAVDENLPEVIKALEDAAAELNADDVVYRASVYARIYGLSFIFAAFDDANNTEDAVTMKEMQSGKPFKFNVLDPLSKGGSITIDNNGLSPTFGLPTAVRIKGRKVHTQRALICYNGIPLYYKFTPSAFAFSGPSVFQNMTLLIRSWNRAIVALQRLATKAAAIIVKSKDTQYVTGINVESIKKNLDMIRKIENDGIASIRVGEDIEFFSLTGVTEVDVILQKLHAALMMALNDTPSGILLDKNLAQGMSDGDNDMKAIIIAVEKFRKDMLTPLYKFVDKYICYKAFTSELAKECKNKYADIYRDMSEKQIIQSWLDSYSFEFNELYPQTANEAADSISKQLDNLGKLKELGAELSGIEEAVNFIKPVGEVEFILSEENIETNEDSEESTLGEESSDAPHTIDSNDREDEI